MAANDVSIIFGADTSKLNSNLSEVGSKLQEFGAAAQKMFAGASAEATTLFEAVAIGVEVFAAFMAALAAANAALFEFGEAAAAMGTEIVRSSEIVGIATDEFQRLTFAASMMDVGAQQMQLGMERLAANMAKAEAGSKTERDAFERMGVSLTDAAGKAKDMHELLLEVADAFAAHADGAEKTALAIQLFGRAGANLIPILNEGRTGIEELGKKADQTGVVFSDRLLKSMVDTNDKIKVLNATAVGLEGVLFDALKPAIDQVVKGFTDFVKFLSDAIVNSAGMQLAIVGILGAFESMRVGLSVLQSAMVSFWQVAVAAFTSVAQFFIGTAAAMRDAVTGNWGAIADDISGANVKIEQSWKNALTGIQDAWKETDKVVSDSLDVLAETAQGLALLPLKIALDAAARAKAAGMGLDGAGGGGGKPSFASPTDTSLAEAQKKLLAKLTADWQGFANTIVNSLDAAFSGLILGTMNFKQALGSVFRSIAVEFIKMVESMIAKWIAGELAKTTATIVGTKARTAAEVEAQTTTGVLGIGTILKTIFADAAKVFANVFAFLSGVMGPAAAGPAAASAAAVAAVASSVPSFDVGSFSIPHDMMAQVHQGEMIVPAQGGFADMMRDAMSGGGSGGGGGGGGQDALTMLMQLLLPNFRRMSSSNIALRNMLRDLTRRVS